LPGHRPRPRGQGPPAHHRLGLRHRRGDAAAGPRGPVPRWHPGVRSAMPTVIVLGGGIIGAACAHYLNRSGWAVTVFDQGEFGKGCSHANCGSVSPSHALPLPAPGAVKSALKALLQPNGPLRIRPRFDPTLWAWLFRFARRCNTHDMLEAARAIQALLNSSR